MTSETPPVGLLGTLIERLSELIAWLDIPSEDDERHGVMVTAIHREIAQKLRDILAALPPAPPQEQERTCGCVIADGGFLVQRVEGCTLEHVPDHEHRAASPPAQEQAADWEGADQIEEDMQESQRSAHTRNTCSKCGGLGGHSEEVCLTQRLAASPPAQEQAADWEGADQIEEDMQESQRSAHTRNTCSKCGGLDGHSEEVCLTQRLAASLPAQEQEPAEYLRWLAHHSSRGHQVAERMAEYRECSCGATFWPAALVPTEPPEQ